MGNIKFSESPLPRVPAGGTEFFSAEVLKLEELAFSESGYLSDDFKTIVAAAQALREPVMLTAATLDVDQRRALAEEWRWKQAGTAFSTRQGMRLKEGFNHLPSHLIEKAREGRLTLREFETHSLNFLHEHTEKELATKRDRKQKLREALKACHADQETSRGNGLPGAMLINEDGELLLFRNYGSAKHFAKARGKPCMIFQFSAGVYTYEPPPGVGVDTPAPEPVQEVSEPDDTEEEVDSPVVSAPSSDASPEPKSEGLAGLERILGGKPE